MSKNNRLSTRKRSLLTAERLREIVMYDSRDGMFYWRSGGIATGPISSGYLAISFDGSQWLAHRLAFLYMTGEWPGKHVDHIDGNPANNAWFNLREATVSQNMANQRLRADNTSGLKGVSLTSSGTWYSCIWVRGKKRCLGTFATKEAAHAAYVRAAGEAFGPFMRIA